MNPQAIAGAKPRMRHNQIKRRHTIAEAGGTAHQCEGVSWNPRRLGALCVYPPATAVAGIQLRRSAFCQIGPLLGNQLLTFPSALSQDKVTKAGEVASGNVHALIGFVCSLCFPAPPTRFQT